MVAIVTVYHGPTNTRGSRITASANGMRVTVPYHHELSGEAVHRVAVDAFIAKHPSFAPVEGFEWAAGGLRSGYAWVHAPAHLPVAPNDIRGSY